jgi:hypothetical protein
MLSCDLYDGEIYTRKESAGEGSLFIANIHVVVLGCTLFDSETVRLSSDCQATFLQVYRDLTERFPENS